MTVQDVITLAQQGELKNIKVKTDTDSVLGFINLGMIELYKRFPLKTEEHIITLVEGTDIYTMPSDYMWMLTAYEEVDENSDEVVKVVPINEEDNPYSINTVSWNKVQVPVNVDGAYISIIYVAQPAILTQANLNDDIDLPPQMIEALLNYIGYRGHGSLDGAINAENNTHLMRFEASCKRIVKEGMFTPDDMSTNKKFYSGGWI